VAAAGDHLQDVLLGVRHAVFGQELAQLLGADSALSGLDPADLGPVAFQDPGRGLQRESDGLTMTAQGGSDEPAPHRG
jgi:hypothetical protein